VSRERAAELLDGLARGEVTEATVDVVIGSFTEALYGFELEPWDAWIPVGREEAARQSERLFRAMLHLVDRAKELGVAALAEGLVGAPLRGALTTALAGLEHRALTLDECRALSEAVRAIVARRRHDRPAHLADSDLGLAERILDWAAV
jgi:hypothetical protein